MRSPRTLAALGSAGLAFLGLVMLSGPIWQPGFDPLGSYGSELVLGPNGWLMTLAFVAGGLGVYALAAAIWSTLRPSRTRASGVALLVVAGTALLASAAVPTAAHRPGPHEFIGLGLFAGILLAILSLSVAMSWRPSLASLSRPGRWAAGVSLVILTVTLGFASPGGDAPARPLDDYAGLLQKLFIAPWLVWLLAVGYRLAGSPELGEEVAAHAS
jgi:uncharacterized protein DUF998